MTDKQKNTYFKESLYHKNQHLCGTYPYEQVSSLAKTAVSIRATRILELGTGIGYATACLATALPQGQIDTIDQDKTHLSIAQKWWETLGVYNITSLEGKGEDILPTLSPEYDLIFFDGYVPQVKFLTQFDRLLRKGGILVTANLFLRDENGGKYLTQLKNTTKWKTEIFADTAISLKR